MRQHGRSPGLVASTKVRAPAPEPPLRALQRRIGNRAARQLIARVQFKNQQEAGTWLKQRIPTRARQAGESDEQYLRALLVGTPYNAGNDRDANVAILGKAAKLPGNALPGAPQAADAPKRNTDRITDKIWEHIVNGEINDSGRVVGLHTSAGDDPVAKGEGKKTYLKTHKGCSTQHLVFTERGRELAAKAAGKPKDKVATKADDTSTFFPADWSLEDIREAIETAVRRGAKSRYYDVVSPAKGKGMVLNTNGASWYPDDGAS